MNKKQEVINARLNKGWTYPMIQNTYGVPKSTAQGWVNSFDEESCTPAPVVGYVNETFQRDRPVRFKKNEDEVMEFLSQLAPIHIKNNHKPISTSLSEYAVVGSDFHFGCHDEAAIGVFLGVVEQLQPKVIVLNGDTMDMLAISRFPKDIKKNWSLLDERKAYHTFLDTLLSVAGDATIYETVSNHSGQSIDGRWRRYLSDRLGELACLPEISDSLSYQNIFMGDYKEYVKHVDYVDLNGLIVTHGTTVRQAGGASCLGEINKWGTSILHGHTHRIGSSAKRIPAIGNRPEHQIFGWEAGCMCQLDAVYATACNWQQGFAIVSLGGESFGYEQVMINNGSANIATLGMTFGG